MADLLVLHTSHENPFPVLATRLNSGPQYMLKHISRLFGVQYLIAYSFFNHGFNRGGKMV
jgi:hypothetical protein